jgi:hypothetical protein
VLDLSKQTKAWMQDDKQLSERLKCKPHKFELKINKGQKIKKCAKCGEVEVEPIISRK